MTIIWMQYRCTLQYRFVLGSSGHYLDVNQLCSPYGYGSVRLMVGGGDYCIAANGTLRCIMELYGVAS